MEKVNRVRMQDLRTGVAVEQREHPWAGERTLKRLARDHLEKNPNAYANGKVGASGETVVVLNQNIKAKISPRKKIVKKPVSNAPSWIPQGMRMWDDM